MTTNQKVLGGILAVAVAAAVYMYAPFLKTPTGFKGFYDNKLSEYYGITSKEDAQIAWHVKNGDNAIYQYGYDSKIMSSSNWPKIASYVKRARKAGIKTFGIPYSSPAVLSYITAYNKAQPNDSSRINSVVSEIEPYITGDYAGFYTAIRTVSEWAVKQSPRVERVVYMGWPSAECWDSIITYTDRLFLHAYLQPERMTGAGIRGYTKSRTGVIANIVNTKYASNATFKYNIAVIFSCEPDFSFNYFKSNSWDKPFTDFTSYFNSYATVTEKNRIRWGGRIIFKSSDGKLARP